MKNYYSILEISFPITDGDIKKAYRQCAFKYHPDINKSTDAHSKFIEVFEAYEVLSSPIERKIYDELYVKTFLNKSISVITANENYKNRIIIISKSHLGHKLFKDVIFKLRQPYKQGTWCVFSSCFSNCMGFIFIAETVLKICNFYFFERK